MTPLTLIGFLVFCMVGAVVWIVLLRVFGYPLVITLLALLLLWWMWNV